MKLALRAAKLRNGGSYEAYGEPGARPRAVLVAVELHDSTAAPTVAAAGVLATALGAELILAGIAPAADPAAEDEAIAAERLPAGVARTTTLRWGETGPAIVEAARQERVDLVVVSLRGCADNYLLHHSDVPVLVVPAPPPAVAA